MPSSTILSTAELRRPVVAAAAVRRFAVGGYHGTTVADVANEAKISPAYVFKLFPGKDALFVAALESCFDQVLEALRAGADRADDNGPEAVLDAMGGAYADLIADRSLLLLQVHAQSAAGEPVIAEALRDGLARVVTFASERSGASGEQVQRFIAFGQLCHLIAITGLDETPEPWARLLAQGIRHP
ncbi:TetR/AcrR family transcriptional regulator [Amnibacterium kyonggiense]|uniref:TetR family transcriptional regulator n=1 Tax=Amnibacterium kyonggiense TaxID=595671 RepID=A0A4R7FRH6_9MICO|nr:TetR/AcrR family transcriptional regulator [Amnibacterium kyonggiense]TDS80318.1 TetR family transcriptional regulator [Amnibacterium kyonggiense]